MKLKKEKIIPAIVFLGIGIFLVSGAITQGVQLDEGGIGDQINGEEGNESQQSVCTAYITGVGCPHCAKSDPIVLDQSLEKNSNLAIIEYEIYQNQENAPVASSYFSSYGGNGVPYLLFNEQDNLIGDRPIIQNIDSKVKEIGSNPCPLPKGNSKSLGKLNLNELPGKPKVFKGEKVLIRKGEEETDSELLRTIITGDIEEALSNKSFKSISPEPVALSGQSLNFEHAAQLNGWIVQWNGEEAQPGEQPLVKEETEPTEEKHLQEGGMTLAKVITLGAADSVNPCAIAVLTLMLIAILTYNPRKKRKILLAGLAFTLSVFVMYLIYGLIIVKFFQLVQTLASIRLLLYQILGAGAIILGILEIKDYFDYTPGTLGTEMPLSLRPKMKKMINGVTSPLGAAVVGVLVTLFLLPCTIGPYIILGGMLSTVAEVLDTLPLLLLYNFIFVLPMIGITLIVYGGIAEVEDVSEWREQNIRYLHLIAGSIIFCIGIAMFLLWI